MMTLVPVRRATGRLLVSLTLAFYSCCAFAAEVHVLALQNEGQAIVAIDDDSKTAFITDLGRNAEKVRLRPTGTVPGMPALELEGKKLLDYLTLDRGTEHLVISCSHPHSDHMAGIETLFRNPTNSFFHGSDVSRPRFKTITTIDDGVSDSLANLYQSFAKSVKGRPDIIFKHESATDKKTGKPRNAFASTAPLQKTIHIENISYQRSEKTGVHGRSLITLTRIGDDKGHLILDFDDADSRAIASAVKTIQDNGIDKIDTFIVPHHGSKAHDIAPILALSPTKAIITVDPNNRYGHPSASILDTLMTKLGPDNVIFTGSTENVVLDQKGVKFAMHTAAQPESAALFVADAKAFALRRQKESEARAAEILLFDKIAGIMGNGRPTDIPPPDDNGGTPRPKGPSGGPSGFYPSVHSRIQQTGSMLSTSFDAGYVPRSGISTVALSSKKIFPTPSSAFPAFPVYVNVLDPDPSRTIAAVQKEFGGPIMVIPESPTGIASQFHSSVLLQPHPTSRAAPASTVAPPQGGMVFLTGGKVQLSGDNLDLTDARIVNCKAKLCLETNAVTFELPFDNQQLFWEVWERVVLKGTNVFYLSINPRKKFLAASSRDWNIPSDKLRFGVTEPATGEALNDVVTAGDIQNSRIGQILWNADVAFKSAALGMNVFTGKRERENNAVYSTSSSADSNDEALSHPSSARWCRMYWTSGSPRFDFNSNSRKVVANGTAVLAQAEPMVLASGKLNSAPAGGWCDREKALAASMQRQANTGAGPLVYQELRQLALMQSFSLWARQHLNIAASAVPSLEALKNTVPLWTSGIRTAPETVVQEEYARNEHGHYVHFYANEYEPFRCLERLSTKIDEEWRAMGLKQDSKTRVWNLPPAAAPMLDKWISGFSDRLASQCKARKRDSINTIVSFEDEGLGRSSFAVHPHVLSSQIHGGILLGSNKQRRPFESAYLPQATIWAPSPSGDHLILRQQQGDLHFWNRTNGTGPEVAEHIVMTDASIKDSYVENGILRFVIDVIPGSVVRKELRAQPGRRFSLGVEWVEASHGSDGKKIRQTAAWPCTPEAGQTSCLGVADATRAKIYELIGDGQARNPTLDAAFVSNNTWVVELDLSGIDKVIAVEDASLSDTQRLSAIQQLVAWGYMEQAQENLAALLDSVSPTAEDTVLHATLINEKESTSSLGPLIIESLRLEDIVEKVNSATLSLKVAAAQIEKIGQLADRMEPKAALIMLDLLDKACASIQGLSVGAKPAEQEGFAAKCRTWSAKYAIKRALVEGQTPKPLAAAQ